MSQFGGIPVEESAPVAGSQFGGVAPEKTDNDIITAYQSGNMPPRQKALAEEWAKRKGHDLGAPISTMGISSGDVYKPKPVPGTLREEIMAEMAEDVGPLQSFFIGAGEGLTSVGRGVGLAEPAGEIEKEAMSALEAENPMSTIAGEVVGEAAPFMVPGTQVGKIASTAGRVAASGALAAAEGGIISEGRGGDALTGAGIGGSIGLGAEILFPVLGKLGRKIFQRVKGTAPRGAMFKSNGQPSDELLDALDAAGMTFDDLNADAHSVITGAQPGSDFGQVATKARAAEEGIPLTKGEVTKDFSQLKTEQNLLESAEDTAAEPLRQFKLKQSEAIEQNLRDNFEFDVTQEETGQLIQDALTGRKKLLRTQKNELYDAAAENAKDVGGVPIFTDNLSEAVPDADTLEDLAITAPAAMESLDKILTKYGIKEPTPEMVEAGFTPTGLTIKNFERFRKTLNSITKGDQTGAASVAIGPLKDALDNEVAELGAVLTEKGFSGDIVKPLLEARKTVRQLKTEFSPKAVTGKLIDMKKDGVTNVTEASKIYSKLSGTASPVEETRKVIKSLANAGEKGEQAIASLQTSTILDLLDAGYGTASRKISGKKVFNPIAFNRRLEKIGKAKMKAIFSNNSAVLRKLNNIEKIAQDLTPPSGAQPKGSASVIMDLADKIGLAAITAKIPGGPLLVGSMRKIAQPVKTGVAVQKAMKAEPEVLQLREMFDKTFPGIAAAIGIPAVMAEEETK